MGSRIAIGAGLALVVGLGIWMAMPGGVAGAPSRVDSIAPTPLGAPSLPTVNAPVPPPASAPSLAAPLQPRSAAEQARNTADVRARVDACLDAQQIVAARRRARGGPTPAGEPSDAGVVAHACAPLFRQPPCRDAHLNFDQPPMEARSATVFQACARAYCPILAAPKPAGCDRAPADGQETFIAWNELRGAILRHDIGDGEAARAFP
jgi:hypothetical protein